MAQQDRVLGREARGPITAERLDVVPWGHTDEDATVEFTTNELTATCPIAGRPDFYEPKLSYRTKAPLVESEAIRLYPLGFRDEGIFAGDPAAKLLKGLAGAGNPKEMTADPTQQVRGGLEIRTAVRDGSQQYKSLVGGDIRHAKRLIGGR